MWINNLVLPLTIGSWFFTAVCLKGLNIIILNKKNLLTNEQRKKYKEQHDIIGMNRYIGKMILLPFSIFLSISAYQLYFYASWMTEKWFSSVSLCIIAALLLICLYGILQDLDKRFKKMEN